MSTLYSPSNLTHLTSQDSRSWTPNILIHFESDYNSNHHGLLLQELGKALHLHCSQQRLQLPRPKSKDSFWNILKIWRKHKKTLSKDRDNPCLNLEIPPDSQCSLWVKSANHCKSKLHLTASRYHVQSHAHGRLSNKCIRNRPPLWKIVLTNISGVSAYSFEWIVSQF